MNDERTSPQMVDLNKSLTVSSDARVGSQQGLQTIFTGRRAKMFLFFFFPVLIIVENHMGFFLKSSKFRNPVMGRIWEFSGPDSARGPPVGDL